MLPKLRFASNDNVQGEVIFSVKMCKEKLFFGKIVQGEIIFR